MRLKALMHAMLLAAVLAACAPSSTPAPTPAPSPIPTPRLFATATSGPTPIPQPSLSTGQDATGQPVQLAVWNDDQIGSVAYAPDGQLVALGTTNGIRLLQLAPLQAVLFIQSETRVHSVAFSADGVYIAAGLGDNSVQVWAASDGSAIRAFTIDQGSTPQTKPAESVAVDAIAFSPDGMLLAARSTDGTVRWWQLPGGQLSQTLKDPAKYLSRVFFSPDGEYFFSGSGHSYCPYLTMMTVSTGSVKRGFPCALDASLSADGELLAAYVPSSQLPEVNPDHLTIFDVESGSEVSDVSAAILAERAGASIYSLQLTSIVMSPDGEYVAIGLADGSLIVWNPSSDSIRYLPELRGLGLPPGHYEAAVSPDSKSVVLAGSSAFGMWELEEASLATLSPDDCSQLDLTADECRASGMHRYRQSCKLVELTGSRTCYCGEAEENMAVQFAFSANGLSMKTPYDLTMCQRSHPNGYSCSTEESSGATRYFYEDQIEFGAEGFSVVSTSTTSNIPGICKFLTQFRLLK